MERPRGPLSPLPGSTVEPMTTSFVSFFRIEVMSLGDASFVAAREKCETAFARPTLPEGTAPLPPQADNAKSAPVSSSAASLLDNATVNLPISWPRVRWGGTVPVRHLQPPFVYLALREALSKMLT